MLNNKYPISPPYKLLLSGFEVIIQVPVAQPINFQYKKPPIAPIKIPNKLSLFFKIHEDILFLLKMNYRIFSESVLQDPPL